MKHFQTIFTVLLLFFSFSCSSDNPIVPINSEENPQGIGTTDFAFLSRIKICDENGTIIKNFYYTFSSEFTSGAVSNIESFNVPGAIGDEVKITVIESVAWAIPSHGKTKNAQLRYRLSTSENGPNLITNGNDTLNLPDIEYDSRGYSKKQFTLILNGGNTYYLQLGRGTREFSPPYYLSLTVDMIEGGNFIGNIFVHEHYFDNTGTTLWYPFHTGKKLDVPTDFSFRATVLSGHTVYANSSVVGIIRIIKDDINYPFEFNIFNDCDKGEECENFRNNTPLPYDENFLMHPTYCNCDPQSLIWEYPWFKKSDYPGWNVPFPGFEFLPDTQYYIQFEVVNN